MSEVSKILKTFMESSAWDIRYSLPLVPQASNPWIYGAYAMKIMRMNGLPPGEDFALQENWDDYAKVCRVLPGLFNRWPDGGGGVTSHDEIMGMAYVSKSLAKEILQYLKESGGVYCNKLEDLLRDGPRHYNVRRFLWLMPYLRSCAGEYVGIFAQTQWSACLVYDALTHKKGDLVDAGGRLKNWIMFDSMASKPICRAAIEFWKRTMANHQCEPKVMLQVEPREAVVFSECAPGSW